MMHLTELTKNTLYPLRVIRRATTANLPIENGLTLADMLGLLLLTFDVLIGMSLL